MPSNRDNAVSFDFVHYRPIKKLPRGLVTHAGAFGGAAFGALGGLRCRARAKYLTQLTVYSSLTSPNPPPPRASPLAPSGFCPTQQIMSTNRT
jgi:hypothetical protein